LLERFRMKARHSLIVAVLLAAVIVFIVVWDASVFSRTEVRYEAAYRQLDRAEREAVARTALGLLENESKSIGDLPAFMNERADEDYLLFVSFALKGGRTKISFGRGPTLFAALKMACDEQARLWKGGAPWSLGMLKVDLVEHLSEPREVDKDFRFRGRRNFEGLMFGFDPPIYLLPEEVWGWNIFEDNGRVRLKILKRIFLRKNRGSLVAKKLEEGGKVSVQSFSCMSFGLIHGEFCDFWHGKAVPLEPLSSDVIRDMVQQGAGYLVRHQKESGRFLYRFQPERLGFSSSYNIVRHAGVMWSLLDFYRHTSSPPPRLEQALARSKDYLLSTLHEFRGAQGEMLLAPTLSDKVKLGAVGLGLLALVEYADVMDDRSLDPILTGLGKFILFCQEPSGKFRHKYDIGRGRFLSFTSQFYSGEAVLALVALYGHTKDERWLEAAKRGARYLIEVRDAKKSIRSLTHDHWLMIALSRLYLIDPAPLWRDHLFKLARAIMDKQRKEHEFPDYVGSFYDPPQSAVAATRAEGLVAAYRVAVDEDPELAGEIKRSLLLIADFLRFRHYSWELAAHTRRPQFAIGAFSESTLSSDVRMDYIQHCISALMGIDEVMGGSDG